MGLKFSEPRMRCNESSMTHSRILRWIKRPASSENDRVEFVHERERWSAIVWEVERECNSLFREGQHAWRLNVSERLENCQERSSFGTGNSPEDLFDRFSLLVERHYELILEESSFAVHPVPVKDRIQWIEERLVVRECIYGAT